MLISPAAERRSHDEPEADRDGRELEDGPQESPMQKPARKLVPSRSTPTETSTLLLSGASVDSALTPAVARLAPRRPRPEPRPAPR